MLLLAAGGLYRWKPAPKRTVTLGYKDASGVWHEKTLVASETVMPRFGVEYFVCGTSGVFTQVSGGPIGNRVHWENSSIFLTCEDARAMADWQAECRRGGA